MSDVVHLGREHGRILLKGGVEHDSDPGAVAKLGGLLMVSVFVIILCLACFICYQVSKRIDFKAMLTRNSRQRIEHCSTLPKPAKITINVREDSQRIESNDASCDADFKSSSNMRTKEDGLYLTKDTSQRGNLSDW